MGKTIEPLTKAGKFKERLTEEDKDFIYSELVKNIESIETELIYEGRPLWEVAKERGLRYWVMLGLCEDGKREELHKVWCAYEEKVRRVSDALYRSAIGGYYEEQQAFKVRVVTDYVNKKGQKCKKTEEEIKTVTVQRYLPPNFNSIQFFLTNKDPKNWKTEIKLANSTEEGKGIEPMKIVFDDPKAKDSIDRVNAIEEQVK